MDINRQNMEVFFTDLTTIFNDAFKAAMEAVQWTKYAMEITSNTKTETHGWINQLPGMREWIGPRVANNIESKALVIPNKKYEGTIEIEREDIEDDKTDLYRNIRVPGLAGEAAMFPEQLVLQSLITGQTDLWADDVAFFSDSRKFGDATIDNLTTDALTATTFSNAYNKMASFLGHQSQPLYVQPFALVHGPALRTKAFEVCRDDFSARTADASTIVQGRNPNAGLVVPIQVPWLVDGVKLNGTSYDAANYWFLLGQKGGIRGCVFQRRMGPEIQNARTDANGDFVFENDKFQFGVRMRGRSFLSMPQLIIGNFAT